MSNRRLVSVAAVSTSATAYTGRADGMFSTNDQAKLKQAGNWPIAIVAPSAPSIGTATAGNNQASVAFTAPSSLNGETITSYTVTSSGGQTATGSSSPIVITGLTNGTTYTFTVVANSASGSSIASSSASALIVSVPAAPTGVTATATAFDTATVAYTAPANNGGSVITSYTATSSPGGFTGTLTQAGSGTITVSGLTGSTAYTFTVKATNSIGSSAASAASNSITTPVPGPATIGQAWGGGFYAGKISTSGNGVATHYLIVAPKASGENSASRWGTYGVNTGIRSEIDGPANSASLFALGGAYAAALHCEGLTLGGYSDWYLPAYHELEVLYYNLKPTTDANVFSGSNPYSVSPQPINTYYTSGSPAQTSAIGFITGGTDAFASANYWSSTEGNANNATKQNFLNGAQTSTSKVPFNRVRAVRRIAV